MGAGERYFQTELGIAGVTGEAQDLVLYCTYCIWFGIEGRKRFIRKENIAFGFKLLF
jgi:hypothetical protein